MNSMTYQLTPLSGLMNHGTGQPGLVRDMDLTGGEHLPFVNRELEAQVRSGDYFISLATTLDGLSQNIADYPTRAKIEDIVSDLIYLYDHYEIDRNGK